MKKLSAIFEIKKLLNSINLDETLGKFPNIDPFSTPNRQPLRTRFAEMA